MPNGNRIAAVSFAFGVFFGVLFGYAAWGYRERWHFDHADMMYGVKVLVRIDKKTGQTEYFWPPTKEWVKEKERPIGPAPIVPLTEQQKEELTKEAYRIWKDGQPRNP